MAVVTIVGAGMMGSALAFPAAENKHEVRLVGTHLDREIIKTCKQENRHPKFMKTFPKGVKFYETEELETALSIITTNYVSNDDIIYAVEQSIDYINPPVQQAFRKFLTQTKLINSNVKLAIEQLKGEINNEIFHEWCDSLIECQDNVTLKKTLQPITTKLSNVRIINAELRNMLMSPRREHVMMVFILLANYPILYFLNSDWFKVLTDTFVGQMVNSIVAIVVIVTVILAYKYTQPIQYKR